MIKELFTIGTFCQEAFNKLISNNMQASGRNIPITSKENSKLNSKSDYGSVWQMLTVQKLLPIPAMTGC